MSSHGSSSTSTPSPTPPTSKKDSNAIDRISSLLDNHFYEIRSMLLWSTIAAGIIALRSSTFGKRYTSAQEIPVHMFGRGKRIGGLFWLDSSNRHKQQLYFHHVPPLNRLVFGRPSTVYPEKAIRMSNASLQLGLQFPNKDAADRHVQHLQLHIHNRMGKVILTSNLNPQDPLQDLSGLILTRKSPYSLILENPSITVLERGEAKIDRPVLEKEYFGSTISRKMLAAEKRARSKKLGVWEQDQQTSSRSVTHFFKTWFF